MNQPQHRYARMAWDRWRLPQQFVYTDNSALDLQPTYIQSMVFTTKQSYYLQSPFSPKTRGIIGCEIEHGIIWPHVIQCMFINTIPVVTIYNSNLPLIWSSRMSSGYLALKWQGVRPPGMDCCMRVIIMFIKLCWDSLSWWINVARLRSRDSKYYLQGDKLGHFKLILRFTWPDRPLKHYIMFSELTIQISVFGGQSDAVFEQLRYETENDS